MKLLGQIVSVGFALWLAQASAVELSIPQVVSFQGQDLNAFVDLQGSDSELQVQPGSASDYAQLQVPRYSVVEQLQLAIVDAPLGGQRLSMRSTRPIVEPNIQLVVRIIDGVEQHVRSLSIVIPAPLSASVAATLQTSENRRTKLTRPKDTLWSVATDTRDSGEVTVQQQMLAIVRLNPDAFIAENVNGLKSGYLLQLPELFEASLLTASAALREVKRQYKTWVEEGYGQAPPQPTPSDGGRLRIVATQPDREGDRDRVEQSSQMPPAALPQSVVSNTTDIEQAGATEPAALEIFAPSGETSGADSAPAEVASVGSLADESRFESPEPQSATSVPSPTAKADTPPGQPFDPQSVTALGAGAEDQPLYPGPVGIIATLALTLLVLLMVWRRRRNTEAKVAGTASQTEAGSDFMEPTVARFDKEVSPGADGVAEAVQAPDDDQNGQPSAPLLVSTSGLPSMSAGTDEDDIIETRIKLAVAFIDVGDDEGARELLQEVLEEGDEEQQTSARLLLEELDNPE